MMTTDDVPVEIVIGDVLPGTDTLYGTKPNWQTMTTAQLRREHRPIAIEGNAWVRWLCNSQAAADKLHAKGEYLTLTADEIERLAGLTWDQARELIRARRAMRGGEIARVWRH